jgi:hypothetical protein
MSGWIIGCLRQLYYFADGVAQRRRILGMTLPTSIRAGLRERFGAPFTVLFLPNPPRRFHIVYKLCDLAAIRRSTNPARPYDAVWHFMEKAGTIKHLVTCVATTRPPINADCHDLRKSHVNRVFGEVFGYPLGVDPTTYRGAIVEKSEANAAHDGRILDGPLEPDALHPEKSYQRLVDNSTKDGMVLDLRVVICGDEIPLVYRKLRPRSSRFANENREVSLTDASVEFSERERILLIVFARAMGADCAELDVLRDNATGKIFVVDLNSTASGPPNHLSAADAERAQRLILPSFLRLLGADGFERTMSDLQPSARRAPSL